MVPDADYMPRCDFNQTQISREEYIKDKANIEQKTKVVSYMLLFYHKNETK